MEHLMNLNCMDTPSRISTCGLNPGPSPDSESRIPEPGLNPNSDPDLKCIAAHSLIRSPAGMSGWLARRSSRT